MNHSARTLSVSVIADSMIGDNGSPISRYALKSGTVTIKLTSIAMATPRTPRRSCSGNSGNSTNPGSMHPMSIETRKNKSIPVTMDSPSRIKENRIRPTIFVWLTIMRFMDVNNDIERA